MTEAAAETETETETEAETKTEIERQRDKSPRKLICDDENVIKKARKKRRQGKRGDAYMQTLSPSPSCISSSPAKPRLTGGLQRRYRACTRTHVRTRARTHTHTHTHTRVASI